MPRALNLLRRSLHYRREAFDGGLKAAGFDLVETLPNPQPDDVLLIWNRYAGYGDQADHFERCGARVLVAENCPLGNDLHGGSYSLALRHVALTGGEINDGGPARWDAWGINLAPYRTGGTETVILAQRGIGHDGIASPPNWAELTQARHGGRIRKHPGTGRAVPLWQDLENAREVITWSSAAALQAMALGVPVAYAHPLFIGWRASRWIFAFEKEPVRDEAARLNVFRRLAWAIWSLDEIRSGYAVRQVLDK